MARVNTKKLYFNSKGFTLTESIIALAILGIILVMGVSVFTFGPRSFNLQVNTLRNQYIVRDVLRGISREARSVDPEDISVSANRINLGEDAYYFDGDKIFKNGQELVSGIADFLVSFDGEKIDISVVSKENDGKSFHLNTEIYIRE